MFNLDYASNGLGRNWFPAKWLACCALFQHIHKSFLLCKRVRPRNHSLIAPERVSRKSISVLGHTSLSFIKTTALFFKHFRIGETPVLDISYLPELPGFTKEPVIIWLSQMCLWTMGYVSEQLDVWCFLRNRD
jgi:hypothetical protein